MIVKTYKCDLCNKTVSFPYGGYRLRFSGCGGIILVWLDDDDANESIICKSCIKGLRSGLDKLPENPLGNYSED